MQNVSKTVEVLAVSKHSFGYLIFCFQIGRQALDCLFIFRNFSTTQQVQK